MTREQLIGTWRCVETDTLLFLRADGSCTIRNLGSESTEDAEEANWAHVDSNRWTMKFYFPPDPKKEWRRNGIRETIDYTIEAESSDRMILSQFDYEYHHEWIKLPDGVRE